MNEFNFVEEVQEKTYITNQKNSISHNGNQNMNSAYGSGDSDITTGVNDNYLEKYRDQSY